MAEQYQEGEVLKGSDGKTYIVVGGVPREQVSAPAIESGVYRLPTSPQKAAEEARKARGAEIAESAEQRAVGGEQRDITKQITDLQKDYRGYDSYKKYTAAVGLYNAGLNTQPNTAGDLELITYAAKMRDPTTGVLGGEAEQTKKIETYVNQIKAEVAKQFGWEEGGTLTPEGREFLRTNLRNAFENNFRPLYLQDREYFTQQALASGIDPVRIVGPDPYDAYKQSIESYWKPKVDAQGREIVAPELRVAEGAEFSTEQDFKRQRDSAEAWADTQGLPFDQALAKFNATMQAKGYGPAGKDTIDVLQWWEKKNPNDRGAVVWELPKSGVRKAEAPGTIAALGSGLLTGGTAGMAEEVTGLFNPEAAAKLEAAKRYAREQQPGAELTGEIIGGLLSPLSRIGPGGTVAGEATRGAVYGGLMGAGEPAPNADLTDRLIQGAIGAGLGGVTGGAVQRVLGGRMPPGVEMPSAGGAPEMPAVAVAPEASPMATAAPTGIAEEVVVEAATMTPQEIGDLARRAVGRGPGSAKAKSQLATIAKSNPEAVAAANRLGLELPVDVLSDNAQLRSLTGLARSEVGSEAETAWGETARSVIQRANQAMDELGATTDLTQVSADVFKRVDDAQKALGNQASLLREEVEATFNTTDRVEPARIREWLQGRIDELGGGKEGLAALSAEEKKLWGAVSKGQPTYARLNEARDMIGQALNKGTGPWADANLSRVKQLYGALADDQINFIEATAGKEIADKQRAANTLFQEMYKGREQMQDIFGKDLSKSLVPLMQRAITSGAKGDISALNQLVSSVPEDMRGTVLTSALFNAAKTRSGARGAEEMFSFTNFSKIYRDLRNNKEVYKQIAKAVGPEGDRLLTDLYAISRRMADAESKVLKTGKANQALDNSLNAERLLNRVLKGAGARLGAATVGGVAAGPVGVAVAGGITEGAQYIAQGMGKKNADKVHALLSSEQFRNLIDNVGSGGNVDQAINRVSSSRPFIDYLKSIGVEAKQGKNWLRSALTVAPVSGVTRQGESQQPVAAPPMTVQQ